MEFSFYFLVLISFCKEESLIKMFASHLFCKTNYSKISYSETDFLRSFLLEIFFFLYPFNLWDKTTKVSVSGTYWSEPIPEDCVPLLPLMLWSPKDPTDPTPCAALIAQSVLP